MEAFEKWYKQEFVTDYTQYRDFKKTWKAALKHILLLNSVRIHDDVYEDIKNELKD